MLLYNGDSLNTTKVLGVILFWKKEKKKLSSSDKELTEKQETAIEDLVCLTTQSLSIHHFMEIISRQIPVKRA